MQTGVRGPLPELLSENQVADVGCRQEGAWRGAKRRRGAPLAELQDGSPDGIEDDGEAAYRPRQLSLSSRSTHASSIVPIIARPFSLAQKVVVPMVTWRTDPGPNGRQGRSPAPLLPSCARRRRNTHSRCLPLLHAERTSALQMMAMTSVQPQQHLCWTTGLLLHSTAGGQPALRFVQGMCRHSGWSPVSADEGAGVREWAAASGGGRAAGRAHTAAAGPHRSGSRGVGFHHVVACPATG